MQNSECPTCGHETDLDGGCTACGHANGNVARPKPTPPPEVAGWVIEPVPPEIAEHFRQTFDAAEYLAEVRELERTGGVQIDDLIAELEQRANGSA